MRLPAISQRLIASLLGVVLLSCSTTPQGAPRIAEADLVRSILLIQELPDGRVIHTWQRAEEFDLSPYKHLSQRLSSSRRVVLAAHWNRNCDEENDECIDKCMDRPLPPGFEHLSSPDRKKGAIAKYCRDQCLQAYRDCMELEKLQSQKFKTIDSALDWLKHNHKAVLVGSVIIIAGVAFVVVSAGTALVILAPALLLTAPGSESHSFIAGGFP
jgi:hypothetical protein